MHSLRLLAGPGGAFPTPTSGWFMCADYCICVPPQIEPHDCIAELFAPVARFNTILIDFDRRASL